MAESHYDEVFDRFEASNGAYVFTWNWWALLFGPFWYITTGLWGKALLYFFLSSAFVAGTYGVATPFVWFAYGALANYDFFLLLKRGTQFWDGAKFSREAGHVLSATPVGSGNSNIAYATPTGFEQRFKLLQETHRQGLLSDNEYESKRQVLLSELEHHAPLDSLARARNAGLLTPDEYEFKRAALVAGSVVSPSTADARTSNCKSCPKCRKTANLHDTFCTGCGHQFRTKFQ